MKEQNRIKELEQELEELKGLLYLCKDNKETSKSLNKDKKEVEIELEQLKKELSK
jgi:hypothetical protein